MRHPPPPDTDENPKPSFGDRAKASFEHASDSTKQLLTIAMGILALTITFSKELLSPASAGAQHLLLLGWIAYLLSVIGGSATLFNLAGILATYNKPTIYATGIRFFSILQIASFLLATTLTVAASALALKSRPDHCNAAAHRALRGTTFHYIGKIGPFDSGQDLLSTDSSNQLSRILAELRSHDDNGRLASTVLIAASDQQQLLPSARATYGSNRRLALARGSSVRAALLSKLPGLQITTLLGAPLNLGPSQVEDDLAEDRVVVVYALITEENRLEEPGH